MNSGIPLSRAGCLPSTLSRLSGLHCLDLRSNGFSGDLPVGLIRLKAARGCEINLFNSTSHGLALPRNIGELGNDIMELDLSGSNLRGALAGMRLNHPNTCADQPFLNTGALPLDVRKLTNLEVLTLTKNRLSGKRASYAAI